MPFAPTGPTPHGFILLRAIVQGSNPVARFEVLIAVKAIDVVAQMKEERDSTPVAVIDIRNQKGAIHVEASVVEIRQAMSEAMRNDERVSLK